MHINCVCVQVLIFCPCMRVRTGAHLLPMHACTQVLIFCESKTDVDDIHEYLMLKGVEAVSS